MPTNETNDELYAMPKYTYTFEDAKTALWAANSQLRAVNAKINELLGLVCVLTENLRANEDTGIYADALGCANIVLETLHEDTLAQFIVTDEQIGKEQ